MGERRGMKALELWSRKIVGGYRDVQLDNMTSSWRDGLAFCAIIHHFRPDLVDFDSLSKENIFYNNNLAFTVAEQHLGIPALLDAEDMVTYKVPDKLSIMTYLSQLYKYFHGMEESPMKSPSKRSLEDKDGLSALAEPPGKLPSSTANAALSSSAHRRSDACHACKNRIYILERLIVDNRLYHRTCFKCHKCGTVLHPGSYVESKESSETYECILCPSDEDRFDRTRLATTAALSRFREHVEQPPQPERFARSARGSVICKTMVDKERTTAPINAGRPEFETKISKDGGGSFDDTGQVEPSSSSSKDESLKSSSSDNDLANGADLQNNNLPDRILENSLRGAVNNKDSFDVVPDHGQNKTAENADKDEVCLRRRKLEFPDDTERDENDADASSGPVGRKSVSEMVKIFGANKERCEMQRVAVVRPQMPPDVWLCPESPRESQQEQNQLETKSNIGGESPKNESVKLVVPQAAPRAHRKKSIDILAPVSLEDSQTSLEMTTPVARQRTRIKTDVKSKEDSPDGLPSRDLESPPPKPPRSTSSSQDNIENAEVTSSNEESIRSLEYPEHLNPFGDEEDDDDSLAISVANREIKSLNPFGSSDEDDENEEESKRTDVKSNLNPFSSDSDSEAEEGNRSNLLNVPPVPASRPSIARPVAPASPSVDAKTVTLGHKKRLAPLPPAMYSPTGSGSATSSPVVTPIPSPRLSQKSSAPPRPSAPPPPPPPPSLTTPAPSLSVRGSSRVDDGGLNTTVPVDASPDTANEDDSHDLGTIKSLKELDNMNRTKTSSKLSMDGNTVSSDSSSNRNTFGYWKRKKPAPGVPIPRRRQIRKLPLAEIQAELFQIEQNELDLERQGVQIEMSIREKFSDDVEPSIEEENLIMQLFELVNKKNALFRRQIELIYLKRQQRLEEEHADLEFQIRCLMEKPTQKKTDEDRELEDKLIARLVDVVHQRSEIIESMEMDRLREAEEDQSIQEQMAMQKTHMRRGSMSSQGSFGSLHSGASTIKSDKSKSSEKDKRKKKEKSKEKVARDKRGLVKNKVKDEDKDTDESESSVTTATKTKEKKRKWFL